MANWCVSVRPDLEFSPRKDGPLTVWEYPRLTKGYVIGVDMAEGLEHGDASIASVVSSDGMHVATYGGFGIEPSEFAERLSLLGRWYNTALIAVEAQSHGFSVISELKRLHRYQRLYYRKVLDERVKRPTLKLGWVTSVKTKPLMIDTMWRLLRTGTLRSADIELQRELTTFRKMPNGQLEGQPHDDRVMSFAIAAMVWEEVHEPRLPPPPPEEPDFDAEVRINLWEHRLPSSSMQVDQVAAVPRPARVRMAGPRGQILVMGRRPR